MVQALVLTREFALALEPVNQLDTTLFFIPQSHFSTIICSEQKPFKHLSVQFLISNFQVWQNTENTAGEYYEKE